MTAKKLTIGILETGRPPEALAAEHGDYPAMVARWLAPLEADFRSHAVLDNAFPRSPEECDLWVITGSRFAVYEDHPWIPPLEAFIRASREAGRRMIGICFGHQIIAQALGGRVAKSDKGWGLGVHDYEPCNWPRELGPAAGRISLQAYHQDQVEEMPAGARRIARSDFCENAVIWYPGFALTVQGHPEFSRSYVRALLQSRRGTGLTPEEADRGLASTDRPDNPEILAELIRTGLHRL